MIHIVYSLDHEHCLKYSDLLLQSIFKSIQALWQWKEIKKVPLLWTCIVPKPNTIPECVAWGGLSGLFKTAQLERELSIFRLIEYSQPLTPLQIEQEYLSQRHEFLHAPNRLDLTCEVIQYTHQNQRQKAYYQVQEQDTLPLFVPTQHTQDTGALLVTGGARGITALCIQSLPLQGRDVILCGRTPLVDQETIKSDLWEWTAHHDEKKLRTLLIQKEPQLTLKACTKKARVLKQQYEIDEQLNHLRTLGAKPHYIQVDLQTMNIDSFADQLRTCVDSLDHISTVIHGAGVIDDQYLVDKTWERFDKVYQIKAGSLLHLYQRLPNVKKWVVFSSVAAAMGNRGQVDYSTANAALDACITSLQKENRQACSIQWGPWKGKGMVSESLLKFYEAQGIRFIHLDEGCDCFVFEYTHAHLSDLGVVCRSWPFVDQKV